MLLEVLQLRYSESFYRWKRLANMSTSEDANYPLWHQANQKNQMKKLVVLSLAAAAFAGSAVAEDKLAVKGSDTLGAKMMPRLGDAYKAAGNAVTFEIEDKGSSTAFTNLEAGTADIGMSSRAAKDSEKEKFAAKGQELIGHVAATDMIAVIVNESNPVKNLTLEQIEGIFTGDITDWSELGGTPGKISPHTLVTSSLAPTLHSRSSPWPSATTVPTPRKWKAMSLSQLKLLPMPRVLATLGRRTQRKRESRPFAIDDVEFTSDNKDSYPIGS